MSELGRLRGETAIVTGAGDSVARVIALLFLAEGANVHICDIDQAALDRVLAEAPALGGTHADMADEAAVTRVFAEATERFGTPTILVNVVGIGGPRVAIEELSTADWRRVMAANVDGMFFAIRAAVPGMKAAGRGAIINFSSGSTRTGLPLRTPYVVSKYAVEGLTKNLARELGPHNIRVNAILPGAIDNARMRGIIARNAAAEGKTEAEITARYLDYISMRTLIQPDELAEAALYLAGPAGRHVTGQLIGVCGNVEWEI